MSPARSSRGRRQRGHRRPSVLWAAMLTLALALVLHACPQRSSSRRRRPVSTTAPSRCSSAEVASRGRVGHEPAATACRPAARGRWHRRAGRPPGRREHPRGPPGRRAQQPRRGDGRRARRAERDGPRRRRRRRRGHRLGHHDLARRPDLPSSNVEAQVRRRPARREVRRLRQRPHAAVRRQRPRHARRRHHRRQRLRLGRRARRHRARRRTWSASRCWTTSGQGTISDVIAALDWAVANRAAYNIRVINLSVGAAVTESYIDRPADARRQARRRRRHRRRRGGRQLRARTPHGQPQYGGITAPGNAPWVLTVGASSTQGTVDAHRRHDGGLQLARPDGDRLPGQAGPRRARAPASSR